MNFFMKNMKIGTFAKCGFEDPDLLFPNVDPIPGSESRSMSKWDDPKRCLKMMTKDSLKMKKATISYSKSSLNRWIQNTAYLFTKFHILQMWIPGSGSTITERHIWGSRYTFSDCGSQYLDPDPDPRQNEMDPKCCLKLMKEGPS